jgi:hypothetical protein
MTLTPPSGPRLVFADSLTQEWLPPSDWQPGAIYRMQTWPIYLDANGPGRYTLGVEVRNGAPETQPPVSANVAATLTTATGAGGYPRLATGGASVLLAPLSLR